MGRLGVEAQVTPALLRELAAVALTDAAHTHDATAWHPYFGALSEHDERTGDEAHLLPLVARLEIEADAEELRTTGKRCACCGAVYGADAWARLPLVGIQRFGGESELELRNCVGAGCATTLAINVPPARAA